MTFLGVKAPPKEPTRYGMHLAAVLFSKEELLPPVNTKLGWKVLDPENVLLIRSKYHYGGFNRSIIDIWVVES